MLPVPAALGTASRSSASQISDHDYGNTFDCDHEDNTGTISADRPKPTAMTNPLQLLQRPSCLLCLEAEYLLMQAGVSNFERVDIERDPALEDRYGHFIPVLRNPADGRELPWPFDAAAVAAFAAIKRDSMASAPPS